MTSGTRHPADGFVRRLARALLIVGCAGIASAQATEHQPSSPVRPPVPAAPDAPPLPDTDIAYSDLESRAINEHRPLNADGLVTVNNVSGSVAVSAWDRNEMQVTGELGADVDHLDISGDPSHLTVSVKLPKNSHITGDTDLKLLVPAGARIDVETVSADVTVQGTRGAAKVNTVSGTVSLQLDAPEVAVQTVSGDLTLRAPSKSTRINSVSGDLHVAGPQDELAAETVSGNIDLEGGKFTTLRLKSISGDIRLDVSLADQGKVIGETLSGDITLNVPPATAGTAQLKSFSGDTECQGESKVMSQSDKKREYMWGDGNGARVELSSFSGDIRVERK
jgi:DUF4097 and DUF4098 domain-containing protein YvlB